MKIVVELILEVAHVTGKFCSREELEELVQEHIEESLDEETLYTNDEAEYTMTFQEISYVGKEERS